MATSNNSDCADFYFTQGSCSIILKEGDLLKENEVDVLVIPTPDSSEPNPDNFVIYKNFYSQADEDQKREIKRLRYDLKLLHPQVISKNGRGCILAVPPYLGNPNKAQELLQKTYTSCLTLAVKHNFRKIAFPTIGCGVIGFDTKVAARIVYLAFESFIQSTDGKKMNEIRVVIFNNKVWNDFTTIFLDLSDSKHTKIKLTDTSPEKSRPTPMPSERDEKTASQRHSHETHPQDYDDDFEDEKRGDQRGRVTTETSRLNPESPEFKPQHQNPDRGLRRYLINERKTELHILQGDILETKVDAIVNATKESMLGGNGVDGAIHEAAGKELLEACRAHKEIHHNVRLPTGRSRILLSYKMSRTAHYIINTAGPCYDDNPPKKCKEYLISCYKTSLALANLYHLKTVSFPAISCGQYGYPADEGAEVALTTVDQSANSLKMILFILKDDDIYDAWVKKAGQLQFTSLDHVPAVTSTSIPPTTNTRKATEPADVNDASNQSASRKVRGGSTSDDTQTSVECTTDQSPTTPDRRGATGGVEFDSEPPKDVGKSGKKKDDKGENKTASNNSPKQNRAQNNNQKPEAQSPRNDTNKSIVSGGFGRGKKKK